MGRSMTFISVMTMKFQKLCGIIAATDLYIALQSQHQSGAWKPFHFNIFANQKSSFAF